jgi:hypothetical protein
MKKGKEIAGDLNTRKIISIIIMCASLLFLTGVNFFLFPQNNKDAISVFAGYPEDNEIPQGPVEEKSTENKNLTSVQEEYLHEQSLRDLAWFNKLSLHKIHKAEKLHIVYHEILVPPPKA